MRWYPLCTRPRHVFQFAKCPTYWNDSQRVDMSLHHSNSFSWFLVNEFLLLLLSAACLAETLQPQYSLVWPDQAFKPRSAALESRTLKPFHQQCICSLNIIVLYWYWLGLMVFNAPFNNITVILWWSVLLVEDTEVPGENHRPAVSHG
jgi:hypothetical protein